MSKKKIISKTYKETLNLPSTSFSMRAQLNVKEVKYIEKWEKISLYNKIKEKNKNTRKYLLQDGPPYANGNIHIGHALNKILKDFIIKSNNLSNIFSEFIPGWDCHGLPIELKIEKKLNKNKTELKASLFRKMCRQYAQEQINIQKNSFKRLGVIADWENYYSTMDFKFESKIVKSLAEIIKNKHITNGHKPVHWCIKCKSSLSEAEIEYQGKVSNAIDITYEINNNRKINHLTKKNIKAKIFFAVWTTTPWTLPSSQAVCLNPKIEYILIKVRKKNDKKFLIFAKALMDKIIKKYEIEEYKIISIITGEDLNNIKLKHPIYHNKNINIILGDHVNTISGTGCVHTAPDHGIDDFNVGKINNLSILNLVNKKGRFKKNILTLEFCDRNIFESEDIIIKMLIEKQSLLFHEKYKHKYPYCWRHKYPLIFITTFQWFISMEKNGLRDLSIKEIEKINWHPGWGKQRIKNMINNRPDWCISRQRIWNTPLCFIINKTTGELHPDQVTFSYKIAENIKKNGIDSWFDTNLSDILPKEEIKDYEKSEDGLDVWFDSGIVHSYFNEIINYKKNNIIYLEGNDQYRGWFMSSLITSIAINKKRPYDVVISHGFTGDANGKKMSKSLGNVIDPNDIIKKYGADILRLWVSSVYYFKEQTISNDILNRIIDSYRRIRNTIRFLFSNINDFDINSDIINEKKMLDFDIWIIRRSLKVQDEIIKLYKNYNFNEIYVKLNFFCSNELGSFYLDIVKDRLYTCQKNSLARRSCQTALYFLLEMIVRWIAPILSFTAEEVWDMMPKRENQSVFLDSWYNKIDYNKKKLLTDEIFWQKIISIKTAVNKIIETDRQEKKIKSSLDLSLTLYCSEEYYKLIDILKEEAKFVFIVSEFKLKKENDKPKNSYKCLKGIYIEINILNIEKCIRCWQKIIKAKTTYDNRICDRCVSNVYLNGETRKIL